MIKTRLIPPTAPETCPTLLISSAGSFDRGSMPGIPKKNTPAKPSSITPAITNRQFLLRMTDFPPGP
jgi:hypothetical protein